ncbi:hypothetical protein [Vibrio sp. TBV020]|uniref:hypothetical protein n=1 Tax=Vibrio sp. TBV020 TaxID=3137398 RepID=UPI0038CD7142
MSRTPNIKRKRKIDNFTRISNDIFSDGCLSFQAMGMLSYLLSKPDSWEVSVAHLQKVTKGTAKTTGRDGVYNILTELIQQGFCERIRFPDGATEYVVQDYPHTAKTDVANPNPPKPDPCKADPPKTTQVTTDLKVTTDLRYSLSENKFSDDDMKLASWMLKRIQLVAPRTQANLDKWADVIRLMRERNKLTHQHITNVFRLANQDSFWKTNILSPGKLRDKFPQLEAKFLPQLPKQSIADPEKSKSNDIAKLDSEINAIESDLEKRRTLDQALHGAYVQSMEKKLTELREKRDQLKNQG